METKMKNMNLAQIAAACGATLLVGVAASPVFAGDSRWYLGGNYGTTDVTIDEEQIIENLRSDGFTTTRFSDDEHDRGHKFFAGYQLNRHLAVEGGYFDLGSFNFTANTQPPGSLFGKIEVDGFNLDLVGFLPLQERLSVFARIGANHAKTQGRLFTTGAVNVAEPSFSERETNHKFGLGVQWALNQAAALRIEAERYRIDDGFGEQGDVDMFSLGLVVRLGAESDRAPSSAQAAPAVVPVVVPAPARDQRYCNIVDMQFEIDAEKIQLQEEEKLLVLARYLKKYPDTTVVIEGHSDNVGSSRDNLRLSQRRADSVMNYLVSAHGINASRLTAVGYGETRPLADNRTEQGKRANRRIGAVVACVTDIAGIETVPARITLAMEIEFEQNKANVGSQYHNGLRNVAEFMRANPGVVATVEGHADNSTPSNAAELSLLRAQNVVNYLVKNFGIAGSRLTAVGFGETRRFAYNTSKDGRQENRRVNIILEYPR